MANPKFEYRNPKQTGSKQVENGRNFKTANPNQLRFEFGTFCHLDLCRISDFVLRIFHLFYLIGRVKVNVEPLPASLSTQIFPPCNSTNFRVKLNPSPVPSRFCA